MDKKEKRVVQIEIDDEVKKLTIEGVDKDTQVVMREELSDDELDSVSGGVFSACLDGVNVPVFDACLLKNQCGQIEAMHDVNNNLSLI